MDILYFAVLLALSTSLLAIGVFSEDSKGIGIMGGVLFIMIGFFVILSPITSSTVTIASTHSLTAANKTTVNYSYATQNNTLFTNTNNYSYFVSIVLILLGIASIFGLSGDMNVS